MHVAVADPPGEQQLTIVRAQIERGSAFPMATELEIRLAELLCERVPSFDQVRFCNSGSEADLMALSLARAVTGRGKILAFEEAYHGGFLIFGHGGSSLRLRNSVTGSGIVHCDPFGDESFAPGSIPCGGSIP